MLSNRFIVLSLLCLHLCLAPSLFGNTGRVPLTPKAATREMLRLMPNEKGFTNKLKSLVKAGANVRAVDKRRMTVLHRVALWGGSASAAKFLLENGGDTPLTNNLRNLPLFQAIYSDNVKVAEVLAEHIDIDFVDASGQTALLLALEYESHKVAKLLLASGASLDVATKREGLTPLHLTRDKSIAELILADGVDPNVRDGEGKIPLHYAVLNNDLALIKLHLAAGADPNTRDGKDGMSPLHYVQSAEAAELLLKQGGNPNIRDGYGWTPLHMTKDPKIVKSFAKHGADINATDDDGMIPLNYAEHREPLDLKLIEALTQYGADVEKSLRYQQLREQLQQRKKEKVASLLSKTQQQQQNSKQQNSKQQNSKEQSSKKESSTQSQEQPDFLVNLNELARKQDSNPLIGREQEIAQVANSIRRKGMRGTVLVGDAGVGKTALIEGLAYLLANDELPELAGREIYSLDVGSMWGHPENKWVGQLQKRVNAALKFIAAAPDKRILFIDEIHQLLGGGKVSASGSPAITDILKPYLGRGDMQLIGATTHDEYQRIIEGDRAIVDRLLRIDIDEPSSAETITILRGIKADYEKHHGVKIGDSALQAAVNLSHRYMSSQQQPRKAITLLDEASSSLPQAAQRLTKRHIASIVSQKIGIPVATILTSQNKKIAGLLPALQEDIYGQDRALEEISSTMSIAFVADLSEEEKPLAALLLAGSTGVGKTETGKALARQLFDSEDNFISVDMSGYKHPTSVVALTEMLTRAVKAKPHSVILLDEVEKANPEVQHLLLQLLDEGRLTDSRQRKVDFTNTIIVLTTNSKHLDRDFAPEFLNRLDKIITYRKLTTDVSLRLVQKKLDELNSSLRKKKITVTLNAETIKIIARAGYSAEFGARAMARVFDQLVKFPLSSGIHQGVVTSNKSYRIDVQPSSKQTMQASIVFDDEVLLEVSVTPSGDALRGKRVEDAVRRAVH